jgi:hypothetical protein
MMPIQPEMAPDPQHWHFSSFPEHINIYFDRRYKKLPKLYTVQLFMKMSYPVSDPTCQKRFQIVQTMATIFVKGYPEYTIKKCAYMHYNTCNMQ